MFNLLAAAYAPISVDCIKACPFAPHLFALAYYQTNPDTQGGIAVATVGQPSHLQAIQVLPSPPLLHLAWCAALGREDVCLLAAASRTNDVLIYEYCLSSGKLSLAETVVVGEGIFCLYLDMAAEGDRYRLLVSSNDSAVVELILDAQLRPIDRREYRKHEFAVWTCRLQREGFVCGDEVSSIYLYAGGQLVARNRTAHSGGLCDLVFTGAHTLYSGGFDGVAAGFDLRKFDQPLFRHNYGGTIWRVLPSPTLDRLLLCNSSENRFDIVGSELGQAVWSSGKTHESLAYAADWGRGTLLTASFYDRKLCLWAEE